MFAHIGHKTIKFLDFAGQLSVFFLTILRASFTPKFYLKETFKQLYEIGFRSLPIVALTAIFTGMVLALQTYTGFSRFSASGALATVVVLSITRELGPVLTGLMIAGRVGSSMAAQVSTMNVTDQIDAMRTLHTDPFHYLMAPRFIAALISLPLLVIVADTLGVWGGYVVSTQFLNFNGSQYLQQTFQYLELKDVVSGLIKAFFFGGAIAVIGCYSGYNSLRGAVGVGLSTTRAVVWSSISIFILNYILTAMLF